MATGCQGELEMGRFDLVGRVAVDSVRIPMCHAGMDCVPIGISLREE